MNEERKVKTEGKLVFLKKIYTQKCKLENFKLQNLHPSSSAKSAARPQSQHGKGVSNNSWSGQQQRQTTCLIGPRQAAQLWWADEVSLCRILSREEICSHTHKCRHIHKCRHKHTYTHTHTRAANNKNKWNKTTTSQTLTITRVLDDTRPCGCSVARQPCQGRERAVMHHAQLQLVVQLALVHDERAIGLSVGEWVSEWVSEWLSEWVSEYVCVCVCVLNIGWYENPHEPDLEERKAHLRGSCRADTTSPHSASLQTSESDTHTHTHTHTQTHQLCWVCGWRQLGPLKEKSIICCLLRSFN